MKTTDPNRDDTLLKDEAVRVLSWREQRFLALGYPAPEPRSSPQAPSTSTTSNN
jgi:hypothetical protein